jgi:threonine dehydrogenase-like Zn-dependent dehydrogenase
VHTFDMPPVQAGESMKAVAVWPKGRRVGVEERATPVMASDASVRLRILDIGICGTDAEICRFDYGGTPPPGDDHLVVGHEALARVVEVGAGTSGLRPGDLVVPMVRRPCAHPECHACRSGHPDFCETGAYTERGIMGAHGFLAEEVVEDERYLVRLAPELRNVGVLTEPLTIAEKGLRQFLEVRRRLPWLNDAPDAELLTGHTGLVLGAGPVGLLGCMLLRSRGLDVTVYSRGASGNPRALLVQRVGGTYISSSEVPTSELGNRVGGIDLVYEAAGASQLAFDALLQLGANGVFVFTGVPGRKHRIQVAGDAIMRNLVLRNQTVLGTVNAGRIDFEAAARDLALIRSRWPGALEVLITGRYPMAQFCERAVDGRGIKDVIAVAEPG